MPKEISGQSFDSVIKESENTVILELFSPVCKPCKVVEQNLIELKDRLGGAIDIIKINVFKAQNIAQRFSVMSVPTVIGFTGGHKTKSMTGIRSVDDYATLVK